MSVTVHHLDIVGIEADCVTLRVDASAGFYVRSLAHDLGERLGVGAHLVALRRTRSGDFTLDHAIALGEIERDPARAAAAVVPPADMLPRLPVFRLSADGVRRAVNGCALGPRDSATGECPVPAPDSGGVRLLSPSGELVAIARVRASDAESRTRNAGALHPAVVLM